MPDLFPLTLILRYCHILGAISLMGGAIFIRFALLPVLSTLDGAEKERLHEQIRQRWAKFVHIAVALLLLSGLANLGLASQYQFSGLLDNKMYNILAGVKFLLALPIFFLASVLVGRSSLAQKLRANPALWMNINLTLALLLVLLGGFLRFVDRTPKSTKTSSAHVSSVNQSGQS